MISNGFANGTGGIEGISLAGLMRGVVDGRFRDGAGTWAQILALRTATVLASEDHDVERRLRELIAFSLVWLEALEET